MGKVHKKAYNSSFLLWENVLQMTDWHNLTWTHVKIGALRESFRQKIKCYLLLSCHSHVFGWAHKCLQTWSKSLKLLLLRFLVTLIVLKLTLSCTAVRAKKVVRVWRTCMEESQQPFLSWSDCKFCEVCWRWPWNQCVCCVPQCGNICSLLLTLNQSSVSLAVTTKLLLLKSLKRGLWV